MSFTAADAAMRAARDRAIARILDSEHSLRVIIAGPGTGKTHVFDEALRRSGKKGLALTFIRRLATDLEKALGEKAETYTFHKYAKLLVYRLAVPGLTPDFILYPALSMLTDEDIGVLDGSRLAEGEGERLMQTLANGPLVDAILRLGTYYDAAAFVDVVYRVDLYMRANPAKVPDYPLVVVDEYQDFTLLETDFITQLGLESPLLIAGDDDQALYDFRYASADYIRSLAASPESEQHELPYCSRCTLPVVEAVKGVIKAATAAGRLAGRLVKPYECFMPDKREPSNRFPKLLDARCTTLQIMARYVEAEIGKIPAEDVRRSNDEDHPTVLIVGKSHFVGAIHAYLSEGRYPQAKFPRADEFEVRPIDGYRRLLADARSNLGWRILLRLFPIEGWEGYVAKAVGGETALVDALPTDYQERHLLIASLLGLALAGQFLETGERSRLVDALGIDDSELERVLGLPEDPDDAAASAVGDEALDAGAAPGLTILGSTLPGAKGLSAEHVFIVGLMDGTFPERNASPTDKEIMEFLVALSRTRTACHLVSAEQFGRPPRRGLPPPRPPVSIFVEWVADQSISFGRRAADLPRVGG